MDELRIAEIHATAAGARPLREVDDDEGDPLAGMAAASWLDTIASEARIALPRSLRELAAVEAENAEDVEIGHEGARAERQP